MPLRNPDVTTDRWTMFGQWAARPENLTRCADRLARFLTGIGQLHPGLRRWHHDGTPVTADPTSLGDLLRRGGDPQFPDHGWQVALWNGATAPATRSTIAATCGTTAPYLKNTVDMVLPQPAGAADLYQFDTMRALVATMVAAWSPSWCLVRPDGLRDTAPRGESIGVFASWLAYLDHALIADLGDLPAGVRRVDLADGSLFVLAPSIAELDVDVVDAVQRAVRLDPAWRLSPTGPA